MTTPKVPKVPAFWERKRNDEEPGVWVGLKKCGCCAAVVVDDPKHQKDVEHTKREFLKSGLSVLYGTWHEWQTKYMPSLGSDCGHDI